MDRCASCVLLPCVNDAGVATVVIRNADTESSMNDYILNRAGGNVTVVE